MKINLCNDLRKEYGIEIVTLMHEFIINEPSFTLCTGSKGLCYAFKYAIRSIMKLHNIQHQFIPKPLEMWDIFPELDRLSEFLKPFRPSRLNAYFWDTHDVPHIRPKVLESLLTKLQNEKESEFSYMVYC